MDGPLFISEGLIGTAGGVVYYLIRSDEIMACVGNDDDWRLDERHICCGSIRRRRVIEASDIINSLSVTAITAQCVCPEITVNCKVDG